jgi:acetolactate synthase-1/2/3 large subunit
MKITGAQALIKALEMEGVEVMFGLPGGCILPAYDPLLDSSIRHILVRHEQGAGHMAEGYAHVTGRPACAMVTSGPAATNMVTPLATPYMTRSRSCASPGQVLPTAIGTDAFQECDTVGITRSVTEAQRVVMSRPRTCRWPFVRRSVWPRPVATADLIDVPKDVFAELDGVVLADGRQVIDSLPATGPNMKVTADDQGGREAHSRRRATDPSTWAADSSIHAAANALRELAELTNIHVVTTQMARGAFPDDIRCAWACRHARQRHRGDGHAAQRPLIALGARFDDRITGKVSGFAPEAKVIHVDIDPAEQGKVRRPDVPIVGDCRLVIEELVKAVRALLDGGTAQADTSAWKSRISGWREQFPLTYEQSEPGEALKPQYCLEQLRDSAPEGTILVSGVGQHQMWSSQYWRFNEPYTWVNSGGLGTMGFCVPAAIGAKVGRPDRTVWAIDGDGCFQMTAQELVTASVERIPIKVGILNNSYLGWCASGRRCSTTSATARSTCRPSCPTS